MSKIVAGTAFVLLGGATVAGGVLLHRGSKSTYDSELPATFADMKSKVQEEGCIRGLFDGLSSVPTASGGTGTDATETIGDDFFNGSSKTTGCLVVNWDKDGYTTPANNGKGTLRFLWAVRGESKGFIVLLVGTASNDNTNKEIKWEAASYSLTKAAEGTQSGTAKKNQEIQTGSKSFKKKSDGTLENNKFPRPHSNLELETNTDFWGLFTNATDLDNICTVSGGTSGCSGTPTKATFRGYWDGGSGTGGGTQKLSEWTQDLGEWGKEIFEENSFKAKALADKQTGTGTNRVKNTNPPQTPSTLS